MRLRKHFFSQLTIAKKAARVNEVKCVQPINEQLKCSVSHINNTNNDLIFRKTTNRREKRQRR